MKNLSDIKAAARESLSSARNHAIAAILAIGTKKTVAVAVLLLIALIVGGYFAYGGISDAWKNYRQEKQLAEAKAEFEQATQDRIAAETRAANAEGKIQVYEQQITELQNDYSVVLDRYRILRKSSDAARDEYEQAKKKGLIINGGNDLTKRFRDLSDILDHADDGTNANANP